MINDPFSHFCTQYWHISSRSVESHITQFQLQTFQSKVFHFTLRPWHLHPQIMTPPTLSLIMTPPSQDHDTSNPIPDQDTSIPNHDTSIPIPDHDTSTPIPDHDTSTPIPDNDTSNPIPDHDTSTPYQIMIPPPPSQIMIHPPPSQILTHPHPDHLYQETISEVKGEYSLFVNIKWEWWKFKVMLLYSHCGQQALTLEFNFQLKLR